MDVRPSPNPQPAAQDLTKVEGFTLGPLAVDPPARRIGDSLRSERLEPRVMRVLVALADAGGGVLSRDDLIALCWDGTIVSDKAIDRVISLLRHALDGLSAGAVRLETITKVGFRLVYEPAASETAADQLAQMLMRLPSIGILPFLNLTGEADQDYFVDGITEEIITALSRFREIRTAPRGSTFSYKGKEFELADVARRLRVDYLLTGTFRMAGGRIRVSAELVHCESRAQVWRNNFEHELTGIFEIQDDLSQSVAAVLLPALRNAEVERAGRKAAKDLTAYDLYLRALPHLWAGTKEDISRAIALLRQSLERDTNATTLGALALSYLIAPPLGAAAPAEALPEALRLARLAIDLDAGDAFAHAICGSALAMTSSDREQVLLHAQESVRLNPGAAFAWGALGMARSLQGEFEPGIESLELAIRLSPSDDMAYLWLTFLAAANFALELYDHGVAAARKAVLRNPNYGTAHRLLAANLVLSHRIHEARAITQARDLVQNTSLSDIRAMRLFPQGQAMERYLDAQRLCGVID